MAKGDGLQQTLLAETGCRTLCGSSGSGVLTHRGETQAGPGVAVLAGGGRASGSARGPTSPFRVTGGVLPGDKDRLAGFFGGDAGPAAKKPATGNPNNSALLLFPDGYRMDATELLANVADSLQGHPIYGAGSTDDGQKGFGLQMGGEGVRSGSVSVMGFQGAMEVAAGVAQSCLAVGDPHFVTESHGAVLTKLDGRRALDVYLEQCEAHGLEDMQAAVENMLFGFPLTPKTPMFTGGDCVVRHMQGFEADSGGLIMPHPLEGNPVVSFMLKTPFGAERDMNRMVSRLAGELSGPPDFGVYLNCMGRGERLYGRPDVDISIIRKKLGVFPLVGMNGGFEIATRRAKPWVYTYTGVLVLFRSTQ
ncbi:MAG: FIST C-terminal domain-containing protein, partial [Deltaproteobacteria bacterium]|nr:FIST C-terminal domain-containing protein [Deltaproteobacteria bacterium]